MDPKWIFWGFLVILGFLGLNKLVDVIIGKSIVKAVEIADFAEKNPRKWENYVIYGFITLIVIVIIAIIVVIISGFADAI